MAQIQSEYSVDFSAQTEAPGEFHDFDLFGSRHRPQEFLIGSLDDPLYSENVLPISHNDTFDPEVHAAVPFNSASVGYDLSGGSSVGPETKQNKNKFFTPKVIVPSILTLGLTAGAIVTGLLGIHLAAPIALGVLAAIAAILAISMFVTQKHNSYKPI